MSRKDYIVIANAMTEQIFCGYVKKKDIDNFIDMMSGYLKYENNSFDENRFKAHIIKGIELYEQHNSKRGAIKA